MCHASMNQSYTERMYVSLISNDSDVNILEMRRALYLDSPSLVSKLLLVADIQNMTTETN